MCGGERFHVDNEQVRGMEAKPALHGECGQVISLC